MICLPCRIAADARVRQDVTRCAACKREMPLYPNSKKTVVHSVPSPGQPRVKCPGSAKHPLITGHGACTGCDCQHHPVKEN